MTNHATHTALVTGATSGLGLASARLLATDGWGTIFVTGRTLAKAEAAIAMLEEQTGKQVFTPIELDLDDFDSIDGAVGTLKATQRPIDLLLLNAGLVGGSEPIRNARGIERTFQASVIGHHVLTLRLLDLGLVADHGRIVAAGSEAARSDMPMMTVEDIPAFADAHTGGDRAAAIQTIALADPLWPWDANKAYATTKALSAWWAASLAERLPPGKGITVNVVSPGTRPQTNAARNMPKLMGVVVRTTMKLIGPLMGMSGPLDDGARRYLDAAEFGDDVNGRFFASPAGKLIGPLVLQEQPHIVNPENRRAGWQAVVTLSGVDLAPATRPAV